MSFLQIALLFCAFSFLAYGLSCLRTKRMLEEFRRYRLARFRALTGWLQLLGASGLLLGFFLPPAGGLAAAGLSMQMACGLGVRVRIGDAWWQCAPATFYMLLCGWIATQLL